MKLLLVLLPLLLTGCAGYANQAYTETKSKSEVEKAAWLRVAQRAIEECPGHGKPESLPPSKAIAYSNCSTELINQEVMPIAAFPEMIIKARAASLRNADAFSKGKISRAEWQARAVETMSQYFAEWDRRAKDYLNQASAQDQSLAIQRQQYFQELQRQQLVRDAIQAQARPRFTNCTGVGNSVNCISQ